MLFAVLKKEGKKVCLDCDHVLVADKELGAMFACRQDACIHEKENMDMGLCGDEAVRLRLLK